MIAWLKRWVIQVVADDIARHGKIGQALWHVQTLSEVERSRRSCCGNGHSVGKKC